MIIDAQVHVYERHDAGGPHTLPGPDEVTPDQMIVAMDAVGVEGAILVSPWSVYRYDASYAVDACRAHPDRFRVVAPFDFEGADTGEKIAEWATIPGTVGVRLMMVADTAIDPADPRVSGAVRAAERGGMPICVMCRGQLSVMNDLARAHPSAQFVVDHLGLQQPMVPPTPPDAFADLPQVLALAEIPNVALKVTGACTMSRRPFPFDDLWEPVGRLIDAFGIDRCMWGTDWTRAVEFASYDEAVSSFRDHWPISADERDSLMGCTAMRIFDWSKASSPEAKGVRR